MVRLEKYEAAFLVGVARARNADVECGSNTACNASALQNDIVWSGSVREVKALRRDAVKLINGIDLICTSPLELLHGTHHAMLEGEVINHRIQYPTWRGSDL